jgi:hypothetical protein
MTTKIKGYTKLSEDQVAVINALKENFSKLECILNDLKSVNDFPIDQRAVSISLTELQTSGMWAVRSIAQPK